MCPGAPYSPRALVSSFCLALLFRIIWSFWLGLAMDNGKREHTKRTKQAAQPRIRTGTSFRAAGQASFAIAAAAAAAAAKGTSAGVDGSASGRLGAAFGAQGVGFNANMSFMLSAYGPVGPLHPSHGVAPVGGSSFGASSFGSGGGRRRSSSYGVGANPLLLLSPEGSFAAGAIASPPGSCGGGGGSGMASGSGSGASFRLPPSALRGSFTISGSRNADLAKPPDARASAARHAAAKQAEKERQQQLCFGEEERERAGGRDRDLFSGWS